MPRNKFTRTESGVIPICSAISGPLSPSTRRSTRDSGYASGSVRMMASTSFTSLYVGERLQSLECGDEDVLHQVVGVGARHSREQHAVHEGAVAQEELAEGGAVALAGRGNPLKFRVRDGGQRVTCGGDVRAAVTVNRLGLRGRW